ncbi:MAG: type II toxin-antitoxin system RelE/ParE family toxin [Deltaproteobacteria bacterium]|nr:type II toxin-antitoxin system RelE/ParE family toxin [Deltaproteobacteria bacterium]
MPYEVYLKRSAEKDLQALPQEVHQKIIRRLLALSANPHPPGAKKLWGGERYRLRVGACRVLYTIDEAMQKIEVSAVGHRLEVYRRR